MFISTVSCGSIKVPVTCGKDSAVITLKDFPRNRESTFQDKRCENGSLLLFEMLHFFKLKYCSDYKD